MSTGLMLDEGERAVLVEALRSLAGRETTAGHTAYRALALLARVERPNPVPRAEPLAWHI